jgi:hypothetical protein
MAAAPLMPGDAYPPKDRGTGGSPPTLVARVRGLERLALAHAGVVVAARVGRAGEADLVPGVCVGVQRRAGAPGPQAPHVRGVQLVPVAGFQVLYGLDQGHLVRARRAGERGRAALLGVGVQIGQGVSPGLADAWPSSGMSA